MQNCSTRRCAASFAPFFPAVAARVRRDFDWKGYRLPRGRRVLLDLYGTDYDPRT
jgi:fatty-acid peroxygenase